MIGRRLEETFPKRVEQSDVAGDAPGGPRAGEGAALGPVSFGVRAGEIVGFAGLEGSGVEDVFQILFGLEKPTGGDVVYGGMNVRPTSPFAAIKQGWGLIPANRRDQGLMLDWSIRRNTSLTVLDKLLSALGLVDGKKERALAGEYVRTLNVATDSLDSGW
jgi:ABC-type sugar transport system ATPase subunit